MYDSIDGSSSSSSSSSRGSGSSSSSSSSSSRGSGGSSSSDRKMYFQPYLKWMKTSPSYNHHHHHHNHNHTYYGSNRDDNDNDRSNYDLYSDNKVRIEKFSNIVTWTDYQLIEAKENEEGEKMFPVKKIRKKILTYDDFLKSY